MNKYLSINLFASLFLLCGCTSTGGTSKKMAAVINTTAEHCSVAYEKDVNLYSIADNVVFTVSNIDEGYTLSTVKANNNVLTANENKYSFVALNRNDVVVETKAKVVNIVKEENSGTIILEKDVYAFGDTIFFNVEWSQHYQAGTVAANGTVLTPSESGEYKYSFVSKLQNTITVNGDVADALISYDLAHSTVVKEKEAYDI